MSLKEDYKDAVFANSRKYVIADNGDDTSSIMDVTEYAQEGDRFGAADINATNAAVNRLNHVTTVTLKAANWTGDAAPYEQTVNVPDATSDLEPILVRALEDGADAATQKAYEKAFGIVASGTGTVGNGTATFKVYKKPETDVAVGLKGV